MEDFSLTIKGFKTFQQVKQFADWYEGQGEQDIIHWLEAQDEPDITTMMVDMSKPYEETDTNLTIHIKPK